MSLEVNISNTEPKKEVQVHVGDIVITDYMDTTFTLMAIPTFKDKQQITFISIANSNDGSDKAFRKYFDNCIFYENDTIDRIKSLRGCENIEVYKNSTMTLDLKK